MKVLDKCRRNLIIISRWEFWPWRIIYFPVFLYYLLLSIRARTFVFFTFPNKPYMKYGGILEESKLDMYKKTPQGLMPKTLAFEPGKQANLNEWLSNSNLSFPLVVKPERGMRGMGVQIIQSLKELENISLKSNFKYIIQEFVNLPKELGILCVKNPETEKWKITSVMERKFLKVKGNGKSTLEELVRKQYRAFLQLPRWKDQQKFNFTKIVPKGEIRILEKFGNHRLGARFNDAIERNTASLQQAMGKLCDQLVGFQYGRLDICFESWKQLEKLESFKIVEVNGTNSEPAHIYDPKHSIFYAWKELFRHWNLVFQISMHAQKQGARRLSYSKFSTLYRAYDRLMHY